MEKSKKRLAFLFSLGFIILAVFVLRAALPRMPVFRPAPLMPFKDADVKQIDLTGTTRSQAVIRQNGSWLVPKDGINYRADTNKVANLLKVLHTVSGGDVVSRNKDKFADLGIGKQSITVEAKNGKYTVYVGANYLANDVYARFDNRPEVFIAKDLGSVNLEDDLRDLRLSLVQNPANVQSLQVDFQGEQVVLIKSGNTWHTKGETPVSDVAVERYIEDIAGLQGFDMFLRPFAPAGAPDLTVVVKEGKGSKAVHFYQHNEQGLLADIEGSEYVYAVDRAFVASLEKKETDFVSPTIQP